MDGLKIETKASGNYLTQNDVYNRWKSDCFLSNLFLFCHAGKICAAYFNATGTTHDSTMARLGRLFDKLDELYQQAGYRAVVNSAFSTGEHAYLLKSYTNNINIKVSCTRGTV